MRAVRAPCKAQLRRKCGKRLCGPARVFFCRHSQRGLAGLCRLYRQVVYTALRQAPRQDPCPCICIGLRLPRLHAPTFCCVHFPVPAEDPAVTSPPGQHLCGAECAGCSTSAAPQAGPAGHAGTCGTGSRPQHQPAAAGRGCNPGQAAQHPLVTGKSCIPSCACFFDSLLQLGKQINCQHTWQRPSLTGRVCHVCHVPLAEVVLQHV